MNENSRIEDPSMKQDRIIAPTHEAPPTDRLMSLAYRGLAPLVRELRTVDEALERLLKVGDADAEPAIRDLRRQIRAFEPSVTMIGQVKAGKTSLVNAMVGVRACCRPISTRGPRSSRRCTSRRASAKARSTPSSASSAKRNGRTC
jgi:hypothetical protein